MQVLDWDHQPPMKTGGFSWENIRLHQKEDEERKAEQERRREEAERLRMEANKDHPLTILSSFTFNLNDTYKYVKDPIYCSKIKLRKAINDAEEDLLDLQSYKPEDTQNIQKQRKIISLLKAIKVFRKYSNLLWTEGEIEILIEEAKKGTDINEIAKKCNHTVEDCYKEIENRNLLKPKDDDDLSDQEIFEDILDEVLNKKHDE